jgi:hypothetical protein
LVCVTSSIQDTPNSTPSRFTSSAVASPLSLRSRGLFFSTLKIVRTIAGHDTTVSLAVSSKNFTTTHVPGTTRCFSPFTNVNEAASYS